MEKKTTQRIIGSVVVVALAIIAMPLLFNKAGAPVSSHVATATHALTPPAVHIATTENSLQNVPSSVATPAAPPMDAAAVAVAALDATPKQPAQPTTTVAAAKNTAPATTAPTTATPAPANNELASSQNMATMGTHIDASNAEIAIDPDNIDITQEMANNVNSSANPDSAAPITVRAPVPNATPKIVKSTHMAIHPKTQTAELANAKKNHHTTAKLKTVITTAKTTYHPKNTKTALNNKKTRPKPATNMQAAWAIQMGNFKVKKNALQLVSKLHAAGYKAFTRDIKIAKGIYTTRVYIGPEMKQASAIKLSKKIYQAFNMQGIVINYKPFA